MNGWALQLARHDLAHAAPWRTLGDVEVHHAGGDVWLRGPQSETHGALLERTPVGARYEVLADGQLVPHLARVPRGYLPTGPWQSLRTWLSLALPPAQCPQGFAEKVTLQLVRDAQPRTLNLLLTNVAAWERWASAAPAVRLQPLRFAAAADGRVLVHGTPLPAMPGDLYCESQGIAAPAGWHWLPAVDAPVVRSALRLAPQDLALLASDGSWEYVAAEHFVQASRSAARLTQAGVAT